MHAQCGLWCVKKVHRIFTIGHLRNRGGSHDVPNTLQYTGCCSDGLTLKCASLRCECFELPFSQVALDNDVLKLGPANCWKQTLLWGVLASETFSLKIFTKQILNPRQCLCAMHGHATVQLNANYLWCQSFSQPAPDKGTKQGAGRQQSALVRSHLWHRFPRHLHVLRPELQSIHSLSGIICACNKIRINCLSKK